MVLLFSSFRRCFNSVWECFLLFCTVHTSLTILHTKLTKLTLRMYLLLREYNTICAMRCHYASSLNNYQEKRLFISACQAKMTPTIYITSRQITFGKELESHDDWTLSHYVRLLPSVSPNVALLNSFLQKSDFQFRQGMCQSASKWKQSK